MFITFEGPDGSGKSTQAKLLVEYLQSRGTDVVFTLEPGATRLGKKLREILLEDHDYQLAPTAELLLFCADRAQHVASVIKPALKADKIVICDRFIDSTTAYQAGGRGFDAQTIKDLNKISTAGLVPDLTIYIDIPVEEGLKRATQKTTDKFEAETVGFHQKVRDKYLELVQKEARIVLLDGSLPIAEIQQKIKNIIDQKINMV